MFHLFAVNLSDVCYLPLFETSVAAPSDSVIRISEDETLSVVAARVTLVRIDFRDRGRSALRFDVPIVSGSDL